MGSSVSFLFDEVVYLLDAECCTVDAVRDALQVEVTLIRWFLLNLQVVGNDTEFIGRQRANLADAGYKIHPYLRWECAQCLARR